MTKEKWDDLSDKARWDIMVAMRGPDLHSSDVVKWFSTSVLRGQMKDVYRVGGLVNSYLSFIILPSDSTIVEGAYFDSQHFCEHVQTAANWMGVGVMKIKSSTYREGVNLGHALRCAKHITPDLLNRLTLLGRDDMVKDWTQHVERLEVRGW